MSKRSIQCEKKIRLFQIIVDYENLYELITHW